MFKFIVRYAGVLKHVPLMAVGLDAFLMIWNAFFQPDMIRAIEQIEEEVGAWAGVDRTMHKYGGLQFNVNRKELGHLHSNGILDVLFTRQVKQTLIAEGLVTEHHVFANSGWVSFYVRSTGDVSNAVRLLRISYNRLAACPPKS